MDLTCMAGLNPTTQGAARPTKILGKWQEDMANWGLGQRKDGITDEGTLGGRSDNTTDGKAGGRIDTFTNEMRNGAETDGDREEGRGDPPQLGATGKGPQGGT